MPRRDAGVDATTDSSSPEADGGEIDDPACVPLPKGSACAESCPERCNGTDDDCDGRVDEVDARSECRRAHARSVCSGDACLVAACDEGWVDCNGDVADGCEAQLDSVAHCGGCRNVCAFANAESRCDAGSCRLVACEAGFGDCDERAANGCERALSTLSDCGACGAGCSAPNVLTRCASGTCRFGACEAGYGDCNGDGAMLAAGDGCETKLDTVQHCGACGVACNDATPYCSGGRCTAIVCEANRADCDDDDSECEADLRTLENCGACGVPCGPLANANVTCATGQCAAVCRTGFRDCDSTLANGCETSIRTSSDCGGCGVACSSANAATSCETGSCVSGGCSAGFGDCNGNLPLDGCEQALDTVAHCGQCGQACSVANAAASCSNGSCQIGSCDAGFGNCDGRADTGCEVDLDSSEQHCGSCNAACPSNRTCVAGRCQCTSDTDCGANQDCCAGACIDTRSDESNCGACGAVCANGSTCCSGTCRTLATDVDNCGSCGSRCEGERSDRCTAGACRCVNEESCPLFWRCCSQGCEFGLGC